MNYRYIVDYDDAIFHNYDLSNKRIIRLLLGNKIDKVMKNSICVLAGNSYLASRAILSGAKHVELFPTVINKNRYVLKSRRLDEDEFVLGWIGSPTTFKYVEKILPVFYSLKEKYPNFFVHIIGAKQEEFNIDDFIFFKVWNEETEVMDINQFDVGIMPLDDTPWEKGKCSYKLIQYMGCNLPVLASPVGMNSEIVFNGVNGYLVPDGMWYNFIEHYLVNSTLRDSQGNAGRKMIEEVYNVEVNMEIFFKIISQHFN